jgi:sugar phosphate isomerase/epimerase
MFSISNIAWTPEEDDAALELLTSLGVHALELAPTRRWPALDAVPREEAIACKADLAACGFAITSFQAILFGQPDLRLFDDDSRPRLLHYLKSVADLCADMEAKTMVFGAPKNRFVPQGMDAATARTIAVEFFQELGSHAASRRVVFGLEANPAAYGCNFCTHVKDVAKIVRAVDSPGLRWHLDAGELAMNDEDVSAVIGQYGDLIGSAHISQPNLDGFSNPWPGHHILADKLRQLAEKFPVAIEMKRQPEGLPAVETAVKIVRDIYG